MKFYNREKEIKLLSNIKKDFRIAVIGRRRIGKTTLVEHFYSKDRITLFVSAEKAEKEIVTGWIKEYSNLNIPNVTTLLDFFDYVFYHLKDKVVFIDEIQNILKVNKSFLFDLQRLIDKYKPKLIVSGSIISLMKNIIEDYKSPLYGRFDLNIKLDELNFNTVHMICKDLSISFEETIKIYSIFGGIPKYYELIEKMEKFDFYESVLDFFVRYPRALYEEVKTMLKEEFGSEYRTFFSILSSISQGKNKHSEIAGYIGKKQTEITKYLSLLKDDFEIISRKTPLIAGKKGIYSIKNNVIDFWFSNIWRYSELLENMQEEKLAELVKESIDKHISKSFEKLIIELIKNNILFSDKEFSKFGSQWGKFKGEKGKNTYEIDIVALNEQTKEILFGECKWKEHVNAISLAKELAEKIKYVEWNNGKRKEILVFFAKSFSKKIKEFEGKKAYCLDLKDMEKILKER